jgi:hypothetical protein
VVSDYLDPVVATVVGDISDLLAKIAEAQGAMGEFAGSAPAIQFDPGALAGVEGSATETAAAMSEAEAAAAMSADELAAAISGPMAVSEEELARTVAETQALTQAADELVASFEEESAFAEQLGTQLDALGAEEKIAGDAAADSGDKAKAAGMNWMALGLAAGVAEFGVGAGVFAMSAGIIGLGYEIAKFGGNTEDALQQIEGAFRGTAERASNVFEPAIESITQDFQNLAAYVEPDVEAIFKSLSGPAEAFGHNFAVSIADAFDAAVPAIEQVEPLMAGIAADAGQIFEGIAGFVQQMAAAFEAGGGSQELDKLAQEIDALLPVLGELTGELGGGLVIEAQILTPALQALADVFNALGPDGDAAVISLFAVAKVVNTLSGPVGTVVDAFRTVKSVVTSEWAAMVAAIDSTNAAVALAAEGAAAEQAGAEMAAAAAEAAAGYEQLGLDIELESGAALESVAANEAAGAALSAEGVEALAAAAGIADLVAAALPFVAAAAAIGVAAYEVVEHWQAVSGFFEQAGDDAYQWGLDIGEGIGRGFEDAWNLIVKPIEDSINGIKNMFTSGFGIMSPSTVTREYGLFTGQGFGLGVLDSLPGVQGQIGAFTAGALGAFGAGGPGGGAGGGIAPTPGSGQGGGNTTYNLTVNVTEPFGTPAEIAEAVMVAVQQLNLRNGTTMLAVPGGRT